MHTYTEYNLKVGLDTLSISALSRNVQCLSSIYGYLSLSVLWIYHKCGFINFINLWIFEFI